MRRGNHYDQYLSERLKNRRFAQSFLEGLMQGEDGLCVEDALRHTIQRMGIKEFCESAGVPTSNIQEFLSGKRKPKPETLDEYLKPFGLKTRLVLQRAS